jgi:hypothetical protein
MLTGPIPTPPDRLTWILGLVIAISPMVAFLIWLAVYFISGG